MFISNDRFIPDGDFSTYTPHKITHYTLDDGRIWSIEEAKFVASIPEGGYGTGAPDENGNSTVEGLIGCLDYYGFDKGELKTDAEYAAEARVKRDALLAETDFMMMPDYPLSEAKRQALTVYRQALRDVPAQFGFPRQIVWPAKP